MGVLDFVGRFAGAVDATERVDGIFVVPASPAPLTKLGAAAAAAAPPADTCGAAAAVQVGWSKAK